MSSSPSRRIFAQALYRHFHKGAVAAAVERLHASALEAAEGGGARARGRMPPACCSRSSTRASRRSSAGSAVAHAAELLDENHASAARSRGGRPALHGGLTATIRAERAGA
jgi:hypothetical protein